MKGFTLNSFVAIFVVAMLFSCVMDSAQGPVSPEGSAVGEVQVTLNLGKVGGLAKSATIDLDSLAMTFMAAGEVTVRRTVILSGYAQQVVNQTVALTANKNWTLQIQTYDWVEDPTMPGMFRNMVVHSGNTSFDVVEGANPTVSLSVNAKYSMLVVRINPLPDSSTFVGLYQGTDISMLYQRYDDTTYTKKVQSETDSVKLYYDWLEVNGMSYDIQVIIRGDWNGADTSLCWGTLNIPKVISGQDDSYAFDLTWIGPGRPEGDVPISVTVGKVGVITVDGTPELAPTGN